MSSKGVLETADRLCDAFQRLTAEPAEDVTPLSAGPLGVRLDADQAVASDVARALWPAFPGARGHLEALMIRAGDDRVAGVVPPAPSDSASLLVSERYTGQRWLFNWQHGLHTGVDFATRRTLVIWEDRAYPFLKTSPLLTPLRWMATDADELMMHAATAGRPAGGVLLVGSGGAGKSTTSMAAVAAGGVTAGDDYVWVRSTQTPPVAFSCFRTVKARHGATVRVPMIDRLEGFELDLDERKQVRYVPDGGGGMVRRMPLLGAVTIRQGGDSTGWRRIGVAEALLTAAPSSVFSAPGDRAHHLSLIGALLRTLPSYELTVSADPDEVGAGVLALVDALIAGEA